MAENSNEFECVLRVLTLNCWGVPYSFFSKKRKERFNHIAEELSKAKYDVVVLQEVFDEEDFLFLKSKLKDVFPFSNMFFSGWLGGDLCIFSVHPLSDFMQYEYGVKGYPHMFLHGDWYTGSAAAYCLINHPVKPVHCFATHLHAEYNPKNDQYFCHRMVQAYQLCQFVEQMRRPGEPTLVIGDMNTEPGHLCHRLLLHVGRLKDAWIESGHSMDDTESSHTYGSRDNTFSGSEGEKGMRIDYILFNPGYNNLHCLDSAVTMRCIPGQNLCYSDHNGVEATFLLRSDIAEDSKRSDESQDELLVETLKESESNLSHFISEKSQTPILHYLILTTLLVLFIICPIHGPEFLLELLPATMPCMALFLVLRVCAVCIIIWVVWDILINRRSELHVLINSSNDMLWTLRDKMKKR